MNRRYLTLSLIAHPLLAAIAIFLMVLITRDDSLLTLLGAIQYFVAYVPFLYYYAIACSSIGLCVTIGVAALVSIILTYRRFSWGMFIVTQLLTASAFLLPPLLLATQVITYCGP